jgi:hypothetical protein
VSEQKPSIDRQPGCTKTNGSASRSPHHEQRQPKLQLKETAKMTVKINFDAVEAGAFLTNQFHNQGLLITTPAEVTQDQETLSHVLRPDHIVPDRHHPDHPLMRIIRGRFVGGNKHSRVAASISFCDVASDGVSATLRVFDQHGDVLDEHRLVSGTCEAKAEIVCPSANVVGFEISGPVDHFEFVTALEFDCLPDADFRMVYDGLGDPLMLRVGAEQVVSARISFFRLHGSHGDVLLSVTKAPVGVTWSFDPLVVHSGNPHVDMEIRATDEAAQVENFAMEVLGVPRSKDVGRHERLVSIPLTVFNVPAPQSPPKDTREEE